MPDSSSHKMQSSGGGGSTGKGWGSSANGTTFGDSGTESRQTTDELSAARHMGTTPGNHSKGSSK